MIEGTFRQEICDTCKKPAKLRCRENGTYAWNCCGRSFVVVGSPMDVANQIIMRNRKDD